jgi:hypothetical protein
MSSFKAQARHKVTGELVKVWCMDDYFGRHNYGYVVGDKAMNEDEFEKEYEFEEPKIIITKESPNDN